jgi:2-keto-4-pentenoate hydratase
METDSDLGHFCGGFRIDGASPEERGSGTTILGHPLNALAWLANHAEHVGTPLKPGDIVTLGSVVKTIYPQAGHTVEAHFGGLSPVKITII